MDTQHLDHMSNKIEISNYARATLPVSVKNRNDCADYDYLDKLNPTELRWLKGFNREYVNADFKHKYVKHFKRVEEKRECYRLNNIRNRCLYARLKVRNDLLFSGEIGKHSNKTEWPDEGSYERCLNLIIDGKKR